MRTRIMIEQLKVAAPEADHSNFPHFFGVSTPVWVFQSGFSLHEVGNHQLDDALMLPTLAVMSLDV